MEAFQSLTMKNEETDVADDIETHSSMATGGDSDTTSTSDEEILAHEALANKKIVYQLALGAMEKPKDIVDAKLEEMIRISRLRAASQKAKDDFDMEAPYKRGSSCTIDDVVLTKRPRSKSLPRNWGGPMESADVDMGP